MRTPVEIAPLPAKEDLRVTAVQASGLLDAADRCDLAELTLWARVAVGTQMAAVTAMVEDHAHVIAGSGMGPGVYQRDASFCSHTIVEPAALMCIPDAREDPRFSAHPLVVSEPWLRFYAGVALTTAGGLALGALCVLDPRPRDGLLPRELRALMDLADEAMRRLERRS